MRIVLQGSPLRKITYFFRGGSRLEELRMIQSRKPHPRNLSLTPSSRKNIENYNQSGKIYVSNLGKLNQTILSILDFIKLLFIKSDEHLRKNEHNIINEKINLDERF